MASKYKALILDVDGTLIDRSLEISEKVKKAILRIKDKIAISLCSGRTYSSYEKYVDSLGLCSLQISDGGGVIVNPQTKIAVYQKNIEEDVSREMIKILEKEKQPFLISLNNKYYYESSLKNKIRKAYGMTELPSHVLETEDFLSWEKIPTPKVTLMGFKNTQSFERMEQKLVHLKEKIHIVRSVTGFFGGGSADVTDKSVTKLSGLVKLLELSGLKREETIVVGDGYNDFPLLMAGGLKVAMGNAVSDLKKIADFIAPNVSDGGVAWVIEKFLL